MKKDDGLYDDCDIEYTLAAHLDAFIFSNSKRNMMNFRKLDGFYNIKMYYSDTDGLYKEENIGMYWKEPSWLGEGFVKTKTIMKIVVYSMDCY